MKDHLINLMIHRMQVTTYCEYANAGGKIQNTNEFLDEEQAPEEKINFSARTDKEQATQRSNGKKHGLRSLESSLEMSGSKNNNNNTYLDNSISKLMPVVGESQPHPPRIMVNPFKDRAPTGMNGMMIPGKSDFNTSCNTPITLI